MKQLILLVEDEPTPFLEVKKWLENRNYLVLPKDYNKMAEAFKSGEIEEFVCQQIKENRDLRLVLCDIKFEGDPKGGNKVVKKIRNNDELDSNYCSLLPIIAITNYAKRQEAIISDGANYSIIKSHFKRKPNVIYAIIETHIERFEKHLRLFNYYKDNKKVFIVHGKDHYIREQVENTLRQMGFEPIVLLKEPSKGKSIYGKIEYYSNECCYSIILYTKCDEGRRKGTEELKARARQNVVFEHGYMCAKFGIDHVCALVEDGIEMPGDLSGIVNIPNDRNNGEWRYKIAQEMSAAGLDADRNKIK